MYPDFIRVIDGATYCILLGELDKETFTDQCAKCPVREGCVKTRPILKNVSTDWHGINATGLYGKEFSDQKDYKRKKYLRGVAKIVGLALCYGGTAFTVSKNMQESQEGAQRKIDAFFQYLSTLKRWMAISVRRALESDEVVNLFGRIRNIREYSKPDTGDRKQDNKRISYARRTALNGPIQSSAGDVLKVGTIRADAFIRENSLNPLCGYAVPQQIDLTKVSYRDWILALLHSVHDELVYQHDMEQATQILPSLYSQMQLSDVTRAFKVKFPFEMDIEFDRTRSWTALEQFPPSEIFLRNQLRNTQGNGTKDNAIIFDRKELTRSVLEQINEYNHNGADGFELLVVTERAYYRHGKRFSLDFVQSLGIQFTLGRIAVEM